MKSQFLIDRNGKQFCLYAGLLDEAHAQGLKEIQTSLVQIPTNDNGNVAIVHATVVTERGTYTGIGDASPQNVAKAMLTCLLRMAETRAKARALRDAVNVGVAALDELDGADDPTPTTDGGSRPPAVPRPTPATRLRTSAQQAGAASPDQVRAIQQLAQKTGETIDLNGVSAAAAATIITRLQAQQRDRLS